MRSGRPGDRVRHGAARVRQAIADSGVEITGHGGAGALAPPNSLEGFTLAAERGVDRIEFDVA